MLRALAAGTEAWQPPDSERGGSRLFYINSWAMIWSYCIIEHTS
jgi:hypothetical protein